MVWKRPDTCDVARREWLREVLLPRQSQTYHVNVGEFIIVFFNMEFYRGIIKTVLNKVAWLNIHLEVAPT